MFTKFTKGIDVAMATKLPLVLEVTPSTSEVDLMADTDPLNIDDLVDGGSMVQEVPAPVGFTPAPHRAGETEQVAPNVTQMGGETPEHLPANDGEVLTPEVILLREVVGNLTQSVHEGQEILRKQVEDLGQNLARREEEERAKLERSICAKIQQAQVVPAAVVVPPTPPKEKSASEPPRGHKFYQKPMLFDGKSVDWEDYKAHFETCARANGWSEGEKATYLCCNMRETPQRFAASLQAEQKADWGKLIACFDAQYGHEKMRSIYEQELDMRTQRKGESLRDLSVEIRRLAELAHPGQNNSMRDSIVLARFIRAIDDDHVRFMTSQLAPKDLPNALDTALHITNAVEMEQSRSDVVKIQRKSGHVRAGGSTPVEEVSGSAQSAGFDFQEAMGGVNKLLAEQLATLPDVIAKALRRPPQLRSEIECYNCHEKGHISRNCPKNTPRPAKTAPQGNETGAVPKVEDTVRVAK